MNNTMYTKLLQSTIPSSKTQFFPSKYEYIYSMPCYKFIAAIQRKTGENNRICLSEGSRSRFEIKNFNHGWKTPTK